MSSDEGGGLRFSGLQTPNWEWCFFGNWYAMSVRLVLAEPPNAFHRFMQRWLLGIHWRKYE